MIHATACVMHLFSSQRVLDEKTGEERKRRKNKKQKLRGIFFVFLSFTTRFGIERPPIPP